MKSFLQSLTACLFLATFTVAQDLEPLPGAITATASTVSLNNIIQLVVPLAINELTDDLTIPLNITQKADGFTVELWQVHFDSVVGPNIKNLGWKEGATDVLQVELSELDINLSILGQAKGITKINLNGTTIDIQNITAVLDISTSTTDQVHWAFSEDLDLSIGNITIKTNSRIITKFIKTNQEKILNGINDALPVVQDKLSLLVDKLNEKIANENDYSFQSTIVSDLIPVNTTMTKYLHFDEANELIIMHMDGRVLDIATNSTLVSANTVWPERLTDDSAQKEQLFVHQSMLNSVFLSLYKDIMPLDLTGDVTDQLLTLFHEFKIVYGNDVKLELDVTIQPYATETPIRLEADRGIVIGSTNEAVQMIFLFRATNDTVYAQPALELTMNLEVALNATFKDFVIYSRFEEINVANTYVTMDNVGMYYHDYDSLLTAVFEATAYNFNQQHINGIDFKNHFPILNFINGLLRDFVMTPLVTDEFIYGGFNWISDF